MSRSRRFIAGVSLGYLYQAIVMIAGLWLTPFLLAKLGNKQLGLWLVSTQILAYLGLLDIGILALLPRRLAYITGSSGLNPDALRVAIGNTLNLVLKQLAFVVLAAVGVWIWFPADWQELQRPFAIVLIAFVILFPFRIFQTVLTGLQELAFVGRASLGAWLVTTALSVGLVLAGFGLFSLAAAWTAGQIYLTAACYRKLRTGYPGVLPSEFPRPAASEVWDQLRRGFWVSVSQIAQVLLYGSDLVVIGRILGPAAIIPYSCTSKLITVLSNQPALLVQSAGPGLSELKTGGSRQHLLDVSMVIIQGMLLVSGAIACVVLLMNQGFVSWWIGPTQYGGQGLEVAFVVSMMLRHWNTTLVYALFCFGRERRTSLTTVVDGALTIAVSIVLAYRIGLYAAPVGSILGVTLVSLPSNLLAFAEETEATLWQAIAPLANWFVRFALVAGTLAYVASRWSPHGFVAIALASAAAAAIYGAVMLPILKGPVLSPYVVPRWESFQSKIALLFERTRSPRAHAAATGE